MSSQSSLKRLGGGARSSEWQAVPSNGAGGRRQPRQWVWERRCRGPPQFVRLCREWAGRCGHVRWEGTSGGGSLRGEETGQRAREPGRGRFGCPKASPIGPGNSSGEPDPDPPLSPPERRRQGSTEGSPAGPGGGSWDQMELSLRILPFSRPYAS